MVANPYDQFVAVPNPYDKFTPTKPTAKPSPKGPGFWETIARAAKNVPQALSDTAVNAGAFGQDLLQTVRNMSPEGQRGSAPALPQNGSTQALIAALKTAPAATVALAKGGVQQVRNLSPVAQQGTAPAMDTTAIQAAQEDLYKRRGIDLGPQGRPFNPQNLSADVIAHPLSAIVDVGGAALGGGGLALRGGKAALEATDLAAALAAARKAPGAVGGVIAVPFKAGGRILDAGATPAAEAVRSSALAKALAQKQALQKSKTTVTNLKAADIPLRKKMTDEASAQAAKGIGVSDIPEAQTLVTDLQAKLNPTGTVVTNPSVGQINLYNDIINTLSPTKGKKPPSLEQVQELRRKIAKPAFGDLEGYGAIDKIERQGLVRALNEVENAYTGGLQAPVQANYTALIAAQKETKRLEKFAPEISQAISKLEKLPPQESIKVAKSIVDKMQKRTLMSKAEYEEFIDLATAATDAKGKSAFRKKLALYGAGLIGISATGGTIAGQATGILP